MAVLEVLKDGHPALKMTCMKVRVVDDKIRKLAEDMVETMYASSGIGLAANQVGEDYRMIVIYEEEEGHRVFINPKIVRRSHDIEYSDEGCLSFPRLMGIVGRSVEILVTGMDLDMKKVKVVATGLEARVFQHEIDHLNGITFVERVEAGTLRRLLTEEEIEVLQKKRAARKAAENGGPPVPEEEVPECEFADSKD